MSIQIRIDSSKIDELIRAAGDDRIEFIIADGVEYGVFQEFSHSGGGNPRKSGRGLTKPGHPSLVPAFEQVTKPLKSALVGAIEHCIDLRDIIRKAAFDIQDLWAKDVNVDTGAYHDSIHVEEK